MTTQDEFALARKRMVDEQIAARGIHDSHVLAVMGSVLRHCFVPPDDLPWAYSDGPLPIGHGQTISQPLMVAVMTQALGVPAWRAAHPGASPHALDVGTGSGYQAAILAELGASVISIERDEALSGAAAARLAELGYGALITCVVGDGSEGYEPGAPYDAIVVGAAAPIVPRPLVSQLAGGGRLVIPVGPRERQELRLITRTGDSDEEQRMEACIFVPLVGRHGFPA